MFSNPIAHILVFTGWERCGNMGTSHFGGVFNQTNFFLSCKGCLVDQSNLHPDTTDLTFNFSFF